MKGSTKLSYYQALGDPRQLVQAVAALILQQAPARARPFCRPITVRPAV
jgi:hypothetical protein